MRSRVSREVLFHTSFVHRRRPSGGRPRRFLLRPREMRLACDKFSAAYTCFSIPCAIWQERGEPVATPFCARTGPARPKIRTRCFGVSVLCTRRGALQRAAVAMPALLSQTHLAQGNARTWLRMSTHALLTPARACVLRAAFVASVAQAFPCPRHWL